MTRQRLLLPATLLTCIAATAPAQERHIASVLLIRCGPSDIILNQPLLEALLAESPIRDALKEEFGDRYSGLTRMNANMPAAHAAGTFQVHLLVSAKIEGEWNKDARKKTHDIIVDHLKRRLDEMLFKQPHRHLRTRRDELQARLSKHSVLLAEWLADAHKSELRAERARRRFDELQATLHEARLEVATEEKVREHLARTREENVALRDHLRGDIRKRSDERDHAENELLVLMDRATQAKDADKKKLEKTIAKIRGQLKSAEDGINKWQEIVGDVQALLTVALEQLPLSELKLHRMRARLTSLEQASKDIEKAYKRASIDSERSQQLRVRAEHEEINMQVLRQQLIEVEGQLARLTPVRYEILKYE